MTSCYKCLLRYYRIFFCAQPKIYCFIFLKMINKFITLAPNYKDLRNLVICGLAYLIIIQYFLRKECILALNSLIRSEYLCKGFDIYGSISYTIKEKK